MTHSAFARRIVLVSDTFMLVFLDLLLSVCGLPGTASRQPAHRAAQATAFGTTTTTMTIDNYI